MPLATGARVTALLVLCCVPWPVAAQTAAPSTAKPAAAVTSAAPVTLPADYVIGPEDVLSVVFWREKDMTRDVIVRPDGRISLPLINEVHAAGLTPEQLRVRVSEAADKFLEDPTVNIEVKQIHSRNVYITGEVPKPGSYPIAGPTTVLQLIAMAGGVHEYADAKNISIIRNEKGKPVSFRFNYVDVSKRKNLSQNIELKPGDTIIVP